MVSRKNNILVDSAKNESEVIEAIIFDLGNVLIDLDHKIAARRISMFSSKSAPEIYSLFFDSNLTELFEEGKISPLQFFLRVKEMLELKIEYAEFVPIWNEIFFVTRRNIYVYNLARRLKANYRLALLSNINILHFEYLKKKFPIFDVFHHIIASYEIGAVKPKPLIYQKALKILDVPGERVFYTDDRKELIESAEALGIKAAVFKDPKQLEKDLLNSGIILDS